MDLISRAARFAAKAHDGQFRKGFGGDIMPYIVHPAQCVAVAKSLDEFTDEQIAGLWLHDVVEDTKYTFDDIQELLENNTITGYVRDLTEVYVKEKYSELNRKERKRLEHIKIAGLPVKSKAMKMIDRLVNMSDEIDDDFKRVYRRESNEMFEFGFEPDMTLRQAYPKTFKMFNKVLLNY